MKTRQDTLPGDLTVAAIPQSSTSFLFREISSLGGKRQITYGAPKVILFLMKHTFYCS